MAKVTEVIGVTGNCPCFRLVVSTHRREHADVLHGTTLETEWPPTPLSGNTDRVPRSVFWVTSARRTHNLGYATIRVALLNGVEGLGKESFGRISATP